MFKFVVFFAVLAAVQAGLFEPAVYSAPVAYSTYAAPAVTKVATYASPAPVAYTAPAPVVTKAIAPAVSYSSTKTYTAHASPVYGKSYATPLAYSAPIARTPVTYSAPIAHEPVAYSAPIAYTPVAPVAYSAPIAHASPVAYSAPIAHARVTPVAYSAPIAHAPLTYSSPVVTKTYGHSPSYGYTEGW